jgi:hypothetical protein
MRPENTIPDLCGGRPFGRRARQKASRAEARPLQVWTAAKLMVVVMTVSGLVAHGARAVEDYFYRFIVRLFYMADLAEGAEELGSDVGEDASALGGDAIADEEKQEPGEELVDLIGGVEFGELIEEVGGKIVGVLLALAEAAVTEAETGTGIADGELAGTACTGALLATDGAFRSAPLAVAPLAIALGKLSKLGRGDRQVLRRERVR